MLNIDKNFKIFVFLLLLTACNLSAKKKKSLQQKEQEYKIMVESLIETSQDKLYKIAEDTLNSWMKSELIFEKKMESPTLKLDSVFCVNSSGNKLIGALHFYSHLEKESNDGINEFFGAKIKGKWYFWKGGSMTVIRSAFKNHDPRKPLNYQQLHNEAMSSFLGGYLTKEGKINDKWFEFKFRDGYIPFKKRYIYKHILDGQQIDNEKDYFNYQWKKAGLMNWIMKFSNDSIAKVNKNSKVNLSRDQENQIRMEISRRLLK